MTKEQIDQLILLLAKANLYRAAQLAELRAIRFRGTDGETTRAHEDAERLTTFVLFATDKEATK